MIPPPVIALATLAIATPVLVAAAVSDVAARTIPNTLPLALAVSGAVARLCDGTPGLSLLAAAGVLFAAGTAWRLGALGGGDVKLLAACALLVRPGFVPAMITDVALAGLVLAIGFLAARGRMRLAPAGPRGWLGRVVRAERWRLRRGGPLPYAVAICAGVLTALAMEAA